MIKLSTKPGILLCFLMSMLMPDKVHAQYCNSFFTDVSYEHITNVTIGAINNSSGGDAGGPVDYTSLGPAAVSGGLSTSISVSIMADATEYIYAFCDWNQNDVLDDPGEVYVIASNTGSNGPHTFNITVPPTALGGTTRMRVMLDWDNDMPDPCRDASYGEAEDYTLSVTAASCTPASATYTVLPDCDNNEFSVSVNLTSLGSATSVGIAEGVNVFATATAPGIFTAGPFTAGSSHTLTLTHNTDPVCNMTSPVQTYACPATNDECDAAITLTPSATCTPVAGNTIGATASPDISDCMYENNGDVWYVFTPTTSSQLVTVDDVAAPGAVFYEFGVAAYSGSCGDFTELDCSTGGDFFGYYPAEVTLSGLTPGEPVYLQVWMGGSYDSNFDPISTEMTFGICVSELPDAPNCSNNVSPANGATGVDIYPNAPVFTWDAVPGATAYNVYLGSSAANATNIGSVSDTFALINGLSFNTSYFWYIVPQGPGGNASGCVASATDFTTEAAPPPPSNDNICEATPLTPNPNSLCMNVLTGQSTVSATQSIAACAGTADDDVWYSFVANATSMNVSIVSEGNGSGDRVHEVFSSSDNTCSGTLTSLTCSDPESSTTSGLTVGNTYFVRVHSYGNANWATFGICVAANIAPPTPVNDAAAGATTLNINAGCTGTPYYNTGATQATGEVFTNCKGTAGYNTVWFKFTAPASGSVKVSNDWGGTLGDSRMALFSAVDVSDYSTFTIIACDDDNGVVMGARSMFYATGLTPGNTYYILVDGYSSSSTQGTFCITVDELNASMIASSAGNCVADQGLGGFNTNYTGWLSLVDADGKLNANVRQLSGTATDFSSFRTVTSGAPRTDANGLAYLNRNFQISSNGATSAELQLFFLNSEVSSLGAPLANLNVSRTPGSTCTPNATGTFTALTQTASGTANGLSYIQVTTPGFSNFFIMSGTTPLPVILSGISAANAGSMNRIDWSTAREENGDRFELERGADAAHFRKIATIAANGKEGSAYSYWDEKPLQGVNYYRLRLLNRDGAASYSEVVNAVVNRSNGFSMQALPNPVNNVLQLRFSTTPAENALVVVSDVTGRVTGRFPVAATQLSIDLSQYAPGIYLVKYQDAVNSLALKVNKQ